MTALLTATEAAQLRLGEQLVIVRAGDRCECARISSLPGVHEQGRCMASWPEREGEVRYAPQDWVVLTGPCPTCGGRGGEWEKDGPHDRWETCPDCIESLTLLDGHAVLTRRIVPLYTECPQLDVHFAGDVDGWDECFYGCDDQHRLLVGWGSIEVVPVREWASHVDTPEGRWLAATTGGRVVMQSSDGYHLTTAPIPRANDIDPLPVPGRDWGIVIDCVEVAS